MNVLLIRKGALGDVLLTTPIARRLRGSGKGVFIKTDCRPAYLHNKDIRGFWPNGQYDSIYDLDLCYERTPKMHAIDAYSLAVFGDLNTSHDIIFEVPEPERKKAKTLVGDDYIVLHMAKSWENRTWPLYMWEDLIKYLGAKHRIVLVGNGDDFKVSDDFGVINLVRQCTLQQTAAIIGRAKAFIGTDSSLLHIAQALKIPSVGIFTCVKAEYRTTGALAVIPDIDCYGCLADEKPPVTYCGCRRKDFKCLELITPEMVVKRFEELL